MVRGIDLFRGHFQKYTEHFILIGGTACELPLSETGGFRATKDIDMLVLLENINLEFAEKFHEFIRNGKYQCYLSKDDKRHFYRFEKPETDGYPPQIELLSRSLFPEFSDLKYTPISEDDYIRSMSAIILSTEYYNYALAHSITQQGLPCLNTEALIAFKVCAYLNLKAQSENSPVSIRHDDLRKHRNDVFRLLGTLIGESETNLPDQIRADLRKFIQIFSEENPEWKAISQSLGFSSSQEMIDQYRTRFIDYFGL